MQIRSMRAVLMLMASVALRAQSPPASGEALYRQNCAACHDQQNPRIPHRETLQKMSAAAILRALNIGAMSTIASSMTSAARESVASYLGTAGGDASLAAASLCADRRVRVAPISKAAWNGWSPGIDNARYQASPSTGITVNNVPNLKLKWAFAFSGVVNMYAQPAVINGTLFIGSAAGAVYALDAQSGCIRWSYEAGAAVRTAIVAVGTSLFFGDQSGNVYSLEAVTGALRWKKRMDEHESIRITGAPVSYKDLLIVPVSGGEEARSVDSNYVCCTMRGSVVAVRARDGAVVWKTYLVDPPKETGKNSAGAATWGPSGVASWSAPTLDIKRGRVYITTGDNYSEPATDLSDAVVALDLKTGRIVWSRQTTPGDIYNGQCSTGKTKEGCGDDFDYGASAMLVRTDGRDLLIAGQKSGIVYALDPDRKGEILWQLRVGRGSTLGGVQWGMASDGRDAYASVSDLVRIPHQARDGSDSRTTDVDPKTGGGLTAIRLSDGSKAWYAPAAPCDPPKPGCGPAQSAALTAIPGAIFSGSMDGHIRAHSTEDGRILWDFDTARAFATVNGIPGRGGSIDGPGAVIAEGMVYVTSGYARTSGMPGNVLLAFEPAQ